MRKHDDNENESVEIDNIRFGLNLSAIVIIIACIVVGILTLINVITLKYIIGIVAVLFVINAYVICIYDYSIKAITKQKLLQQLFIYLLVFIVVIVYLLLSIFGG